MKGDSSGAEGAWRNGHLLNFMWDQELFAVVLLYCFNYQIILADIIAESSPSRTNRATPLQQLNDGKEADREYII